MRPSRRSDTRHSLGQNLMHLSSFLFLLFFVNTLAIKETYEITEVVSYTLSLLSSEQNIFTAASCTLFDGFRIFLFMRT